MKKATLILLFPAMLFAQEKTTPTPPKQQGKYQPSKKKIDRHSSKQDYRLRPERSHYKAIFCFKRSDI